MTDEFKTLMERTVREISRILDEFSCFNTDDADTRRRISYSVRVLNACLKQLALFGDVKKETK